MARQIVQHRRGTTTEWGQYKSLIPQDGEIVLEMNEEDSSYKLKIGNGTSTYEELDYLNTDAPCTSGEGLPDTAQGSVGGLYLDTLTGNVYKCAREDQGVFVWEPINKYVYTRTIKIESPFSVIENCGIRSKTTVAGTSYTSAVGNHVDLHLSPGTEGSTAYGYYIFPNLPIGEYHVTTRSSSSQNYPYYAFLVNSSTGIVEEEAIPSEYITEGKIEGTVNITNQGTSLYVVSHQYPKDADPAALFRCEVTQTLYYSYEDYLEESAGNEPTMRLGRDTLAQCRADFVDYNFSQKFLNFAWITDPHYNDKDRSKVSINNLRLFSELCNEKFVDVGIVGGDLTTSLDMSRKQTLDNIGGFKRALSDITIPVYYMKGNHDINTKCMMKANTTTKTGWAPDWENKVYYKFGVNPNNGSVLYSAVNESTWNGTDLLYNRDESQLIPNHLWAMHCQRDIDAVFDESNPLGGYFYKDFEQEKVRVIVTNCYDVASQLEGINWGMQQTKFIAEQALNFSSKEDASSWSVILFSHDMPADLAVDDTSVAETERCKWSLIKVLQAFQSGTSCTCTLMDNRSYTFDFSNQGAMTIIATVHGHAHEDMHDTVYGWNNVGTIASYNSWGTDYIGTIKEFGVSVFTVDTENKVLYETRIGRGNSRAFSFGDTIGLV